MTKLTDEISLLFETSWEVCNKVGGIYTVLSTKAKELHDALGDRLVFIGPDVWTEQNPSPTFIERKTLLKNAARKLTLPAGISIRVGRWDIPGSPIVVLVSYDGVFGILNKVYGEMWNLYNVDSLHAYGDYNESCAFAVASGIVIKALTEYLKADPAKVIAHFDEWTTGMGLLYIKANMPQAATVFTTHATSIGRSICSNGKPLYDYFTGYNGDQMARELNMESKHSLEKAAAHAADCFTTVSEVTARECRQLLGIEPQVITPNGFEPNFVPGTVKAARLRQQGRKKLLSIASVLTGRQWPENTFIVATSGRNEFRNKGIDLFLDAVAELRSNAPERDILALVLVPAWVKEPQGALLMDFDDNATIKPDISWATHRLNNEDSDHTFRRVAQVATAQGASSVSLIDIPCYLDGHDGIVDISYYDLLPAIDLTVFPSYYEPWGYTPLESIAFGIPTVSSDKAGFGQWILSTFGKDTDAGVEVIKRTDSNYSADVSEVARTIADVSAMSPENYAALKQAAVRASKMADWKFFIKNYWKAFDTAFARRDDRLKKPNA